MGVFSYITGIIGSTLSKPDFLLYMDFINAQGQPTHGSTSRVGATTGAFQVSLFAHSVNLSASTKEDVGWRILWDHTCQLGFGQVWPQASSALLLCLRMHHPSNTGSISKHWDVHRPSLFQWSRMFRLSTDR